MRIYYSGMGLVFQPAASPEGVLPNTSVMLSYSFVARSRAEGGKGQWARLRAFLKARKGRRK